MPRQFQRELCKLRLVSKKFYAPATRYLLTHGTLTFDVSYVDSSTIKRQIEYCMDNKNKNTLARSSGLRVDLRISECSRKLPLLGQQQSSSSRITATEITDAEAMKEEFLSMLSLNCLRTRFKTVTALELRLGERDFPSRERCFKAFLRLGLPMLEDLYIRVGKEGKSSSFCHPQV
jgi:hypothetical protein